MKLLGGAKLAAAERIHQKTKSKNRFSFNYLQNEKQLMNAIWHAERTC